MGNLLRGDMDLLVVNQKIKVKSLMKGDAFFNDLPLFKNKPLKVHANKQGKILRCQFTEKDYFFLDGFLYEQIK